MASNLSNLDTTTLSANSYGSTQKSLFIGGTPVGVNWTAVQIEIGNIVVGNAAAYPNLRALLNSTVGGRLRGDTNNSGGIDIGDSTNIGYYRGGATSLSSTIREWISTNIEIPMSTNSASYIAEGSYYNPSSATPTISIFGGGDRSILTSPLTNLSKIFFDSRFDYLRVKAAVTFTLNLPARNTRSSGGGKKGGSGLQSYNGYSDTYIYYHNYGSPPPAFTMFLNDTVGNGSYAGMALAGSVPIQYASNNSFRIALVYSTDKYLVLRERYQVYQNSLPALSLAATAYFYSNPTSVNAYNALAIVHSPVTFNDVSPYGSPIRGRTYSNTVTFTAVNNTTFNKVEIWRFGGGSPYNNTGGANPYKITAINGSAVTPFDCYGAYTTPYTYGSQQTSWSMTIQVTDIQGTDAIGKNRYVYYTPRWAVRFTNTATGQTFTDSWGGVISFYIKP